MQTRTLIAEQLFDGEQMLRDQAMTLADGRIIAIGPAAHLPAGSDAEILHGLLAPGFIDVQVNGGGGALFNADPSPQCIYRLADAHARYGTTGLLPTLITDDVQVMQHAADAIAAARRAGFSAVLGVHFEGPHLSVARRGVHSADFIRPISDAEWRVFAREDLGVKVVTVAPETVPADDIRKLVAIGVRVCLGHSNADYDTVMRALDAGATGFTHLYNAMSPLTSRAPGMVGAALLDTRSWCGLIVDGVHAHPAAMRVALNAKARGKIMLVTDAMPPVGSDEREFEFFGAKVIRDGDTLRDANGSLAGSTLDMAGAVRNSMQMLGVSAEEALRMAALYPAAFLGLSGSHGRIASGVVADLVLLDAQWQVTACWRRGEKFPPA